MKEEDDVNNAINELDKIKERIIEVLYWTECKTGKNSADAMLTMFIKDLVKKYTVKRELNRVYAIGLMEMVKDLAMEREER